MAIVYDGKVVRLQVNPGKEGMEEFQRQVRLAFKLGDDVELDCIFDCRAPGTGEKVKLRGMESYSAAMHCAAVAAGERLAKHGAAGNALASSVAAASVGGVSSHGATGGSVTASTRPAGRHLSSDDAGASGTRPLVARSRPSSPSAAAVVTGPASHAQPGRCTSPAQLLPARTAQLALKPTAGGASTPTFHRTPPASGSSTPSNPSREPSGSSLPRIPQSQLPCLDDGCRRSHSQTASTGSTHARRPGHDQQQQQQGRASGQAEASLGACPLPMLGPSQRRDCSKRQSSGGSNSSSCGGGSDASGSSMGGQRRGLLAGLFRSLAAARRVM